MVKAVTSWRVGDKFANIDGYSGEQMIIGIDEKALLVFHISSDHSGNYKDWIADTSSKAYGWYGIEATKIVDMPIHKDDLYLLTKEQLIAIVKDLRKENDIKFVSYNGAYPNLCSGTLVLEIDGEKVSDFCLSSGGAVWFDGDWGEHVDSGEWSVDVPEKYESLKEEITKVVNCNVPVGCCGGCI